MGQACPERLPITPMILRKIYVTWAKQPLSADQFMLWAAFCLGFFGFLRAGEFTCPSPAAFSPSSMLEVGDVSIDSHASPSRMQVTLKCSKTDPFGAGFVLHFCRTGDVLCPMAAMLGYLAQHPSGPRFLFLFQDGTPLSRPRLCLELRQALNLAGVATTGFSGHSFRIGAATTAARMGLADSLIQTLGRWKSSTFLDYIRMDGNTVAGVSATLAKATV